MEPTASGTFNGLFDGKTKPQIERSIWAHRGALTKIFRYIDTACNAVTVLPTSKGAREIETLRFKMEEKIEEIEAGYDTLIEMQPEEERKYLEKKAGISDEAIQTHARILPALAKCPSEVLVNRTHQGGDDKDPQVCRCRERKGRRENTPFGFVPGSCGGINSKPVQKSNSTVLRSDPLNCVSTRQAETAPGIPRVRVTSIQDCRREV